MTFLFSLFQVIIDKFYTDDSVRESGTLAQLKCLINQTNFDTKATHSHHADSAIIDLVNACHVFAAIMKYFDMHDVEDRRKLLIHQIEKVGADRKAAFLHQHISAIVDQYIFNPLMQMLDGIEDNHPADSNQHVPELIG